MRWFKRASSQEKECVSSKTIHRIRKEWSDSEAKHVFILYRAEELSWSDGSKSISKYWQYMPEIDSTGWRIVACGDREWAIRQAKHYKIEIS